MRFESLLKGSFQEEDNGLGGQSVFTEFSRNGFRVNLDQRIDVGTSLHFDIRFPGGFLTVPATGKVVWLRRQSEDDALDFDAGVSIEEIDRWDRARLLDYAYENWRKLRKLKASS